MQIDWDALDEHCTPEFAAQVLQVSVATVKRWLRDRAHPLCGKRFSKRGNWYVVTGSLRALWLQGYRPADDTSFPRELDTRN